MATSDRQYMELAIEEMRKSRSEHASKVDPKVGAVLVDTGGKIIGQTHRGNLREGDHAEFTLIERLLGGTNLEGATLYVTLEPCTTRNPPKSPCVRRIIAARLKRVVIGMPDPNPEIQGKGISTLLDHAVIVDFFDPDLAAQVREENSTFIEHFKDVRCASVVSHTFDGPSDTEKETVPNATIADLSVSQLAKFFRIKGYRCKSDSSAGKNILQKHGMLEKASKHYVPTVAGLLLFGRNPQDFLVQSKVLLESQVAGQLITDSVSGSLLTMAEKIEKFLRSNMRTGTRIEGFKRIETPEYPLEALREAVVNALVHRDYKAGWKISLQMYPQYITIRSPGLPLPPLTLEKIRNYKALPYSRNPLLAAIFSDFRLMEERGWGFKRMRDILHTHGLPPPEFEYDAGYFVVTLHGKREAAYTGRSKRLDALLHYLRKRRTVTAAKYASLFRINERTARRQLKAFERLGLVEKKGKGRATHYVGKNI